ncbi:EF-P 5-aminopentanol modification-associated protein YfmF [Geobacillus sp. TFV-3]|uniref:EF-P 5-aminopentanol modification-associated protein YfmF n=1 Tax=Geobacillus sp. TFV-3 TaxID=1897059 RepID=UPI0013581A26|nr:pitrilysin family protein [Geobacillus sp. TFV-3]KAF0996726.1 Antilisterial bacteriocin subtilosin biosynthesis protein AlbE [Geobacillus sp. TFV-3]
MKIIHEQVQALRGLTLHTIETKKFKTNTFILRLKQKISEDIVTFRSILPYVLQNSAKKEIRKKLDELYGATLNISIDKKGEFHIITLRIEAVNEKYLPTKTQLIEHVLNLIFYIVMNPWRNQDSFNEDVIQKEKQVLKQRILSVYDNKIRFANKRLIEEMCKEEPYRIHAYGNMIQIDQVTSSSLYDYYHQAILEDQIDLYIVGDVNHEKNVEIVDKLLQYEIRNNVVKLDFESKQKEVKQVNYVTDEQEVEQGKLHLGYRTYTNYGNSDYYALQVFNGMFGGFPHSKLLTNIREKESLAYYISSRYESHKELLFLMAGIEIQNYEKTLHIINKQLESLKRGDFSKTDFQRTKTLIKSQLLGILDDPKGIVEMFYRNVVNDCQKTMEDWLLGIDNVSESDVIKMAHKIKLDTVYFLKGRNK